MKNFKKLILITFPFIFCASCGEESTIEETRKYEDYAEFSFSDVTKMYELEEEHYYVEFYSETCPYCEKLKTSLFDYLDKFKKEEVTTKVYIFDARHAESDVGKAVRANFKSKPENYNKDVLLKEMKDNEVSTVNQTYWFSIPGLYEVTNGKYTSYTSGTNDIANIYSNLK